jgi:hypothetical protein
VRYLVVGDEAVVRMWVWERGLVRGEWRHVRSGADVCGLRRGEWTAVRVEPWREEHYRIWGELRERGYV